MSTGEAERRSSNDSSFASAFSMAGLEGGAPACDALSGGQVHVWFAPAEEAIDSAVLVRCGEVLSDAEQDRERRFAREQDRRLYRIAHALLRTTLSRYLPLPPRAWSFGSSADGRPYPELPPGFPRLRASLSHTEGLAACAVAVDRDIGVDVEMQRAREVDAALLDRCLSDEERRSLLGVPREDLESHFLEVWTLKEAYLKARGTGLNIDLSQLSTRRGRGATPGISFSRSLAEDPERWQFALHRPTAGHQAALAVSRLGAEAEVSWRFASWMSVGA